MASAAVSTARGCGGAAPPIALKAARIFDGKTAIVSPGAFLIIDGKIAAAGPNIAIPADAQIFDPGDSTLLPDFINAHSHLSVGYAEDWKQDRLDLLQKPVAELALDATLNLRKTLMAGFTTTRDVGSSITSMSACVTPFATEKSSGRNWRNRRTLRPRRWLPSWLVRGGNRSGEWRHQFS